MQAATVNEQHATPTLRYRLLDEVLGLMSGGVLSQVVQVQFGLRLNLAARERADQVVGHAKSRTGQFVAVLIYMQRILRRPQPCARGWRGRVLLPLGHGAAGPAASAQVRYSSSERSR